MQGETRRSVVCVLRNSGSGVPFDQTIVSDVHSASCPTSSMVLRELQSVHRLTLLRNVLGAPAPNACRACLTRCPGKGFVTRIGTTRGGQLCRLIRGSPSSKGFGTFFSGTSVRGFFGSGSDHPCLTRMHSLCSGFLFRRVSDLRGRKGTATVHRVVSSCGRAPCLATTTHARLSSLRCLDRGTSFRLLGPTVIGSRSLDLLGSFLYARRCGRFHSRTGTLHGPFILRTVLTAPASMGCCGRKELVGSMRGSDAKGASAACACGRGKRLASVLSVARGGKRVDGRVRAGELCSPRKRYVFRIGAGPGAGASVCQRAHHVNTSKDVRDSSLGCASKEFTIDACGGRKRLARAGRCGGGKRLRTCGTGGCSRGKQLARSRRRGLLFTGMPSRVLSRGRSCRCSGCNCLAQVICRHVANGGRGASNCLAYLCSSCNGQVSNGSCCRCSGAKR